MYLQKKPKLAKLFCILFGASEKHASQGYDLFFLAGDVFSSICGSVCVNISGNNFFGKHQLDQFFFDVGRQRVCLQTYQKTNGPKFTIGPPLWIFFCFEGLVSDLGTPGLTMVLLIGCM